MKVADVCAWMEEFAPLERACEWDHVGLMIGDRNREVTGILTCLDATLEVLEEAVQDGRNMVISHHPFLFHPLSEIEYTSPRGRLVAYAIQHGLNIYSAHTNLDYAEKGVNWALASRLGLSQVHWDAAHHHMVGILSCNSLKELYGKVSHSLGISLRAVVPMDHACQGDIVVGISSGAFDGETQWCLDEGVQILVTGEVKHSDAIDLTEMPFLTISAGHFATERWIAQALAKELGDIANFSLSERVPLKEVWVYT